MQFTSDIDLNGKEQILLIVPPGESVLVFQPYLNLKGVQPVAGTGGIVYSTIVREISLR